MCEIALPASPNWYCSHVMDANTEGMFVFGARRDVMVFDVTCYPAKSHGVFRAHRDKVSALALSPHQRENTNLCCSGSEDGKLKIWKTESKEQLFEHANHRGKLTAVSWSPLQTDLVVSGDDKGDIVSWQHQEGRLQMFSPEHAAVMSLSCSPACASHVAVGYKAGLILIIDIKKDGEIIQRLRGHDEDIQCLGWCPIPGENFKAPKPAYQDLDNPNATVVPAEDDKHASDPDTADFGENGHLIASGSKDKTIRIWSTTRGRQLMYLKVGKSGGREQGNEYGGAKMWTTFVWLKNNPRQIVSSSAGGDLLRWDITTPDQQKSRPFCAEQRRGGHYRMVFNVCLAGREDKLLCSMSMDRQVIVWNSDSGSMFGTLPTLGGFVYVAKTSPVDPGRLAFGVGDSMIRLWNLNNTNNLTDVRNLWQGVKGKVTALSWHPVKEGLLAYGTDDGRVGVYDTLSNRTPSISSTYHKRTVYVVAWGPACTGQGESRDLMVYSIGDGIILGHDMSNLYEEASDINSLIEQTNGKKVKLPTRSEISWSPDMAFVAIGNDDGSVEIFKPPDLQLIVTIHIHKKLINCVQWHPHITMATPGGSPYKYWIATASNEAGVYVVDLSSILDKEIDVAADPLLVAESRQCLLGHVDRVTGVAWSPHNDQQLATVSYDGQALVWDVDKNEMLACYQGHNGRLLCVVWNGLEDDLVLTGADDFSLHQWRLSLHPPDLVNAGRQRKQKYKKKPKKDPTVSVPEQTDSTPPGQADVTLTTEDQESLEKILEEKRHQILLETQLDGKEGIPQGTAVSDDPPTTTDPTCSVTDAHTSTAGPAATVVVATEFTKIRVPSSGTDWEKTKHDLTKDKKKRSWKGKSFFPLSGRAENRGKELLQDDLVYLATKICGPTAEAPSDVPTDSSDPDQEYVHLGFFLDRRGMYKCLKQEGQHHQDHDNMDYYYQLEIWKGNVNGALRLAREREELSDWLVSMAPMANVDTWITVCEDYATQLESEGQYHKAATYLLAAHKVYEAIQIFRRHRLFKEAIALAKVRLSPFDPVLEELYTLWAQQLTRDGNYEQAAKCHLAMKQVQDAALLLARRYNQSSLRTASHICLVAGEKQQGLMYAYKASQQYAVQSDWSDAYRFLKDQKPFQCLSAVTAMHELLMYEIQKISVDNMAVDEEKFTKWEDMGNSKVLLPDFMLDAKENEPISPWQPYLIEGHTFPHHMLRTLHTCLDISMDTANLEDMYKALSVLHAGRQVQTDIQQLLSQVCMDLVLCLLSLLMSETPTAISHLLQAISILHEAAHYDLMELILRLFLPQGPKYLLKLQQEVTAMRVIISMDNNGSVDGASKVHTIKRYLSEIKEDEAISNTSLRCRELDSLRAYYYLVILNFLKKNLCDKVSDVSPKGLVTIDESSALNQASSSDNVKGQSSQGSHSAAAVEQERTENQSDPVTLGSSGDPVTLETSAEPVTLRSSDGPIALGSRGDSMTLGSENGPVTLRTGSDPVTLGSGDNPVTLRPSGDPMASGSGGDPVTLGSGRSSEDNCDRIRNPSENENKVKCDVSEDTSECVIERISQDSSNQTPSIPSPSGKCDTIAQLSREENLSDEKRLPTPQTPTPPGHEASDSAISEENTSPGAINKEATESSVDGKMSESKTNSEIVRERLAGFTFEEPPTYQLTLPLLSHLARGLLWDMQGKRYALTETLGYIHKAISQLLLAQRPSALPGGQTDTIAMGELSVVRDGHFNTHSAGHLDHSSRSLSDTAAGTAHVAAEPPKQDCVAPKVRHHSEPVIERPVPAATGSDVMSCPFHGVISRSAYSRSVSIDSGTADVSLSLQEHLTSLDLDLDASSDCAFGMCSSCELLTKSRRVLWEDQPHPHSHPGPEHQGHHGKAKLTSIVNPAKYINVPDEWYNTAADQKYCMPYVTMAILKDEQEYMMRELKRGPDALQMPFPNPLESVKLLLVVSGKSNFLTVSEKREFAEKMVAWGLQFSVSSQQKETLMESMHRTLTHE